MVGIKYHEVGSWREQAWHSMKCSTMYHEVGSKRELAWNGCCLNSIRVQSVSRFARNLKDVLLWVGLLLIISADDESCDQTEYDVIPVIPCV